MATIKNLLIRIGVSDGQVATGVRSINKHLDSVASRVERLGKLGRVGMFTALAGSAIQLGRAFAPATAALGHFAVAAAPAAGAILALPAAIAVAGAAVATLKVGLSGMGAAFKAVGKGDAKALDKALKKLSPSAREFVLTMARAKNSFDPVRRAVQQKLFAGLAAQMRVVVLNALPGLRSGMSDVATQMNGMAKAGLSAAKTPLFNGVVRQVLGTTAAVLASFKPAIKPLILGLARLVSIGLPLVEVFGKWLGKMATSGATFLASDRAAASFTRTIDRAIGVFRKNGNAANAGHKAMVQLRIVWVQLSAIGKNVWSVIQAVGKAIQGSTAPSKSLLQLVTDLTARMATWANSAQGQKQLSQLFASLQQVAANLIQILPQLGGVLTLILGLINSLPGPVRNIVLQMLAWSIVLSRFSGPIGGVIKLVGGLGVALGDKESKFRKFASAGVRAATAVGKGIGTASVAIGRASASAVAALARMVAASAVTVARVVAGWALMAVQSLIQAARMALAWFIALGPIGWITAAVIAIVILIIAKWATVKKWTLAIWHAVVNYVMTRVRDMLTAIGWLARIPGAVYGYFSSMVRGAISAAGALVRYVQGIPGAIIRAFAGAGSWLYNAGKNILVGLWNGLVSVASWLARSLWNLIKSIIPGVVQRVLGISSPSVVMARLGGFAGQGLAVGMESTVGMVQRAAGALASAAVPAMRGVSAGTVIPAGSVAASAAGQRPGARGAGAGGLRVTLDVNGGDAQFRKMVQKWVRVQGGGDVQVALGGTA